MSFGISKALGLLLGFGALVHAVITKSGSTVNLDGTYYYIPATAVSTLGLSSDELKTASTPGEDLIPMTVMTGDFTAFDASTLQANIDNFSSEDDVFSTGFLQGSKYL
jgi:hypothetical protein